MKMTIGKKEKTDIIERFGTKYGTSTRDTGSSAVQIALLTKRINNLKPHFSRNIHDYHSNRGLMKLIGKRKALLRYIQKTDNKQYQAVIKDLGLRK